MNRNKTNEVGVNVCYGWFTCCQINESGRYVGRGMGDERLVRVGIGDGGHGMGGGMGGGLWPITRFLYVFCHFNGVHIGLSGS